MNLKDYEETLRLAFFDAMEAGDADLELLREMLITQIKMINAYLEGAEPNE